MKKIFYFNIPSPTGNTGDDVLYSATIKKFESFGEKIEWTFFPVRHYAPPAVIDKANESDLVLIGGGGLINSDTIKNNDVSGWQWRCPIENLKKLKAPLIFYSVGYNMMEGQEPFHHVFNTHIKLTAEKSVFFSLRNHRSKDMLVRHGVSADKMIVNHCPSLFLVPEKELEFPNERPRVGINLGGDRMHLRVQDREGFFSEMRKLLKGLNKDFQICFINHSWNPLSNCQYFIDTILNELDDPIVYDIETIWDYENDVEYVLNLYRSMDVVLGMRGHAQMIAFGQAVPVVSLISHNKLRWFLEDVDMSDTGLEVYNNYFADEAEKLARGFIENPAGWKSRWKPNFSKIKDNFDKNNRWIQERYFK